LLGNIVHDSVPVDNNEDNNKIERYNTVTKREAEGLLNHVDLCYRAELSDTEKAHPSRQPAGSVQMKCAGCTHLYMYRICRAR
jgi:seryl-tRNA synthetase